MKNNKHENIVTIDVNGTTSIVLMTDDYLSLTKELSKADGTKILSVIPL